MVQTWRVPYTEGTRSDSFLVRLGWKGLVLRPVGCADTVTQILLQIVDALGGGEHQPVSHCAEGIINV